jgi:hypothetical protein
MKIIIGNTGLVGKTVCETVDFDQKYNTTNIGNFFEHSKDGDELFLTCLPATKWMINKNLGNDLSNINQLVNRIARNHYSKITLISTIDVYNDSPLKSNEDYSPNVSKLSYGNNRYLFELMIRELVKTDDLKIFRLPALFNKHIKKNVLFDLINGNNVEQINGNSSFQWYNLENLMSDVEKYSTLYPNETVFNLFTEPIDTMEIVKLFPQYVDKVSHSDIKVKYDYTTKHNEYISSKESVLEEIKNLIHELSIK